MCNEKKDFSLLRPFDEEAAKRGESICTCYGQKLSYQAGPDVRGTIAVLNEHDHMITRSVKAIHMAPICWVEGKPVYKGDRLWHKNENTWWVVEGFNGIHPFGRLENHKREDGSSFWAPSVDYITWHPPKVKRKVSLLGFIHYSTKEVLLHEKPLFNNKEFWNRYPQLDTTVEIEE